MSVKLLFYIAGGGAIGAVGRYSVTVAVTQWTASGFPYGTLIVNIMGSFLLGCLLALLAFNDSMSQDMRVFLQVGVLGAFTTFSTFSMEAYQQISRGDYLGAGLYIGVTVVVGICALIAGVAIVRQLFA
jgi:fluoride exporter